MIIVKSSPLGANETIEVAPNSQVIDYLEQYDDQPHIETDVLVNNKKLVDDCEFERVLREGDILTIQYRPSGIIEAATSLAVKAVKAVLSLIVEEPDYDTGSYAATDNTATSTNNSVSGQTNTVRKYQGIPNIYGRVWSYPDLISNSIPEWISNRKQVRELFLIGEGEYEKHQVRDGSTDIDDIEQSSYTFYEPYTYPAELYRAKFSDEVNDEELIAPDDDSIIWSGTASFENGIEYILTSSTTAVFSEDDNSLTIDYVNDYAGVDVAVGEVVTISGTILNNGTQTVSSVVDAGSSRVITFTGSGIEDEGLTSGVALSFARSRIIADSILIVSDLGISSGYEFTTGYLAGPFFADGYVVGDTQTTIIMEYGSTFSTVTTSVSTTIQKVSTGTVNEIGPFTMPTESEQIWFNIKARNGLQSDSGGTISVSANLYVQQIDDGGNNVGSPISQAVTLTGGTTKELGKTVKFTGLGGSRYKVYAHRTTNRYTGSAIQDIFWEEVFTINSYSGENFGDVTTMEAITKASINGTTSSRKINCDVTRKINGVATTNFADCVVDLIVNKGNRPASEIDTDELYEIADSLSDDLKEFSYTFSDKDQSLASAVQVACNVARVNVYREGQTWRFNRDEAKERTYVFNRRNLASGDNQKQTFSARQPQDYDSVSLQYYNRDEEDYDQVYIKIDADTQTFTVGEYGSKPSEIELAGCYNYAQALNRAHLEARKIVYQRRTVEDVALLDAANVDIGDRVAWCDIYDGDTFDGEITGQDGNVFYTSEAFRPEDGVTYYVMVTKEDGEAMTPVEVEAVDGNENAFSAILPDSILLSDNYSVQLGSRYIIGSIDDIDDSDYTVFARGGDSGDSRISLELIQYSDNIYEMDG